MLPSVLEVLARNYNNRNPGGRFYEIGAVYIPAANELPDEKKILCIGLYGEEENFFTLKGIVEEVIGKLGITAKYKALSSDKSYHPGRCAEIIAGGEVIGVLGELHPMVSENFSIGARAYCAELKMEKLMQYGADTPKFKQLPKFPSMTRDLSLLCDTDTAAGDVAEIIAGGAVNLEQLTLFDTYTGAQVPEGKKSLSYKLVFRKADATLTDDETDKAVAGILRTLEQKNINLR
jgi:phenylalanyl-tRNA synthetase beta chain